MPEYYFGQGKVYLFPINPTTKLPLANGYWVGNVATNGMNVSLQTENYEHSETYTGDGLTDLSIETKKTLGGTIQFEEWSLKNLRTIFYGRGSTAIGATVTAEPHTAKAGGALILNNINLTAFTSLTGTGGSPTYVANTDYKVDLRSGTVDLIAGGAIDDDDPVLANYTFGNYDDVTAFSSRNVDYWLRFNGLNRADNNSSFIVDICRVRIRPPANFNLISDEMSMLECEFGGLYVEQLDVPNGDYEGGFMRIRKA
jgi:hypothetical protein